MTTHAAHLFDEHSEFEDTAARFLRAGIDGGERVLYAGAGSRAMLRAGLTGALGNDVDLDRLLALGTVSIWPAADIYTAARRPEQVVRAYEDETRRALDDGYRGLRAAADVSVVVSRAAHDWRQVARYEHLLDRSIAAGLPFNAMCGYRRDCLGDEAKETVACLHPESQVRRGSFRLFADHDARLALTGAVDATTSHWVAALEVVLGVHRSDGRGVVELDCSTLEFIDHRALLTLDHVAAGQGVRVRVVDAPYGLRRLHGLLALDAVEVASEGRP